MTIERRGKRGQTVTHQFIPFEAARAQSPSFIPLHGGSNHGRDEGKAQTRGAGLGSNSIPKAQAGEAGAQASGASGRRNALPAGHRPFGYGFQLWSLSRITDEEKREERDEFLFLVSLIAIMAAAATVILVLAVSP